MGLTGTHCKCAHDPAELVWSPFLTLLLAFLFLFLSSHQHIGYRLLGARNLSCICSVLCTLMVSCTSSSPFADQSHSITCQHDTYLPKASLRRSCWNSLVLSSRPAAKMSLISCCLSAKACMLNSLLFEILGFSTGFVGNLLSAIVQLLLLSHHSSFPPPTHTSSSLELLKRPCFSFWSRPRISIALGICSRETSLPGAHKFPSPPKKKIPSISYLHSVPGFFSSCILFPRLLSFIFTYIFQMMEITAIDEYHLIA